MSTWLGHLQRISALGFHFLSRCMRPQRTEWERLLGLTAMPVAADREGADHAGQSLSGRRDSPKK
jgi:hypothetical protein